MAELEDKDFQALLKRTQDQFQTIAPKYNKNQKKLLAEFLHCGAMASGLKPTKYLASNDVSGELEGDDLPFEDHEHLHILYGKDRRIRIMLGFNKKNILECTIRRNLAFHPFDMVLDTYTKKLADETYELKEADKLLKALYDIIS